jgi:hypothetical protein
MSDTHDDARDDDGIRTQDLGYGDQPGDAQGGGGLGTALPGVAGSPPTGTGEQVVDSDLDEAATKPTSNTSSGSPAVNSPGATG